MPANVPTSSDGARTAARRLRAAIRRALLLRAAWGSFFFGLMIAGGAVLAFRIARPGLDPLRLLPWCAAPVAVLFAVLAIPALRRIPSYERCLAAVESASRAGGLALCEGLPGAEAWPAPEALVPGVRFRPSLRGALPLAAAFCALALALPSRLFEQVLPAPPDPTGIRALATREERRLDALLEEGALDERKAAELREWLDEARANAESSSQASLLETLDHVSRALDDAALAAATASVEQANALQAAEAVAGALAEAGDLPAETAADASAAMREMLEEMGLDSKLSNGEGSAAAGEPTLDGLADASNGGLSQAGLQTSSSNTLPKQGRPGSDIPDSMKEQLAKLLAQMPPEKLATLLRKAAAGGRCEASDAPELSLRDLLAMQELLDELTPEALADLASVLEKLSPQDARKVLGSGANPSKQEWMSAEEFRELLKQLHAAANLTSNQLERLLRQGGSGCQNCKKALLPNPSAALDQLLQQHSAAAEAAAAALSACQNPGAGQTPAAGQNPGAGGTAAPLNFTHETAPAGPGDLRDAQLPNAAAPADPSAGVLVGVSAGDPDAAPSAAPVATGALDPAAAAAEDAGETRAAPVLPRHQNAVRAYFGDSENE